MASQEVDVGQLSESQQLALQQYTAVTDQDVNSAIPLLQRSQWNVQIAIAKFFDGEGPDPVAEALAAQNTPPPRAGRQDNLQESLLFGSARSSSTSRSRNTQDDAPRIVPQPEDQVVHRPPFILSLLFTPFSLLYKLFSSSFGLFSFLFPFLPRLLRPNTATSTGRRSNTTGRRSLKPRDSAARIKREFEEEYGDNTLPFYEGGYAQALDVAKKDLKFLLILLISPEHDDTSSFIRDTLLTPDVQSFVANPENEMILWVGDVRDSEAYQVATALRCNKFPFTGLIAHTPQLSSTSMSVLTRLTGPMPAGTYVAKLQSAITAHSEQLAAVRATRSAQNFERTLREEQDSAYERSLAQDRERARVKREAEAAAAEQEQRALREAEAAADLAEKRKQWRKWRAKTVLPEPSPDDKDVARIALKMPEAARIIRRFPSDAGVEELYAFVECYEFVTLGVELESVPKPEGYEHKYDFRLVSTLPRVVYEPENGGTIIERVGKSGNLIVEPIKDDEDED
ncbi:UBX domain-containing 10 [Hyphodiscus hymeniophilus]|uniref:UBX domain-containing 10 n=1 Tax=Hyphodiscus hymeniophilus TaxID=353542 RepID=A0A9P7AZS5_9HELO|nr:UBX domain-containing 10 [Hyphodiscus hymeniophilus]